MWYAGKWGHPGRGENYGKYKPWGIETRKIKKDNAPISFEHSRHNDCHASWGKFVVFT
jgi:hypothetical protein